jgi:hypothetical protein
MMLRMGVSIHKDQMQNWKRVENRYKTYHQAI